MVQPSILWDPLAPHQQVQDLQQQNGGLTWLDHGWIMVGSLDYNCSLLVFHCSLLAMQIPLLILSQLKPRPEANGFRP